MKLTIVGLFILIVVFMVIVPIALMWSIECLWGVTIALTFKNWFAAFLLGMILGGGAKKSSS